MFVYTSDGKENIRRLEKKIVGWWATDGRTKTKRKKEKIISLTFTLSSPCLTIQINLEHITMIKAIIF